MPVALALTLTANLALAQPARVSDGVVRIGVLGDMSGQYSEYAGGGTVHAVRMAVEDFGGKVLGRPIEVVFADHQNKADIASTKAREWFDVGGVDLVTNLQNSAVAVAVLNVARDKRRVAIVTGATSSVLTNENCTPYSVHYVLNTDAMSNGIARAVIKEGGDSWFFITLDLVFGHSLEKNVGDVLAEKGGKVVGRVRHPLGIADYSSLLLQAQNSGAKVIGLANAGNEMIGTIKGAHEFGLTRDGKQRLVPLAVLITDIHSLGLPATQGMLLTEAFYWDQSAESRKWARRYFEKMRKMPTQIQAGDYSSTMHYLKAVQAAGTDNADEVMKKMRETPVNDFFARNGRIRADGLLSHDMYLYEVKKPAESTYPWDYYKLKAVIPADDAFRPLNKSACALVQKR